MAVGAMNRTTRILPGHAVELCGWVIPPRVSFFSKCYKSAFHFLFGIDSRNQTPVSMTTYWMHNDPVVFPNPESFEPNRWLAADPDQLKTMGLYHVPFAKGSRSCVGKK